MNPDPRRFRWRRPSQARVFEYPSASRIDRLCQTVERPIPLRDQSRGNLAEHITESCNDGLNGCRGCRVPLIGHEHHPKRSRVVVKLERTALAQRRWLPPPWYPQGIGNNQAMKRAADNPIARRDLPYDLDRVERDVDIVRIRIPRRQCLVVVVRDDSELVRYRRASVKQLRCEQSRVAEDGVSADARPAQRELPTKCENVRSRKVGQVTIVELPDAGNHSVIQSR